MNLIEKQKKALEAGEKYIKKFYRLLAEDTELINDIQRVMDERKWNMPTLITEALREFVK